MYLTQPFLRLGQARELFFRLAEKLRTRAELLNCCWRRGVGTIFGAGLKVVDDRITTLAPTKGLLKPPFNSLEVQCSHQAAETTEATTFLRDI